jgi:hypothetical protein
MEAVKNTGYSLELRNNYEIVIKEVKNDEYTSTNLQNNYKIVIGVVKSYGLSLQHTSTNLQNNYKIVIEAVKNSGYALQYASLELRNNYKIVIEAVKNSGKALKYCSNIQQNNYFIILTAIKTYEEDKKRGYACSIEIPFKYINKYKRIEKIKEVLEIYCEINKFEYNNFSGDFDLLIKNEF